MSYVADGKKGMPLCLLVSFLCGGPLTLCSDYWLSAPKLENIIIHVGGHCKKLAPVWDELAEKVESEAPEDGILLAKVDCTKEKAVCSRFKIRGYPTLIYFAERSMIRYSGGRDVDSLAAFATGGYKEFTGEAVPAPPSWLDEKVKEMRKMLDDNKQIKTIAEDFEHIVQMRKNAAVVLVAIGLVVGLLLGCIFGGAGGSKRATMSKSKKE